RLRIPLVVRTALYLCAHGSPPSCGLSRAAQRKKRSANVPEKPRSGQCGGPRRIKRRRDQVDTFVGPHWAAMRPEESAGSSRKVKILAQRGVNLRSTIT